MTKVFDPDDLNAAVDLALKFDAVAIVERCVVGDEYTVAVLQGEALPSIRIETPRAFYDYRAKYESDRTRYHCPGTATAEAEQETSWLAMMASRWFSRSTRYPG
jgi:D-alanine-D-alanine ligase